MPVLDTISFRSGKVVVYKSGALIPLPSPNVIMGCTTELASEVMDLSPSQMAPLPKWLRGDHHRGGGACGLVGWTGLVSRTDPTHAWR